MSADEAIRMPRKRKVSNLLALAVLSYLTLRPMHPYELGRTLRENGDARSIKFNYGALYMVVQKLLDAGYIAAQGTSREGQRPERTVFALTDAGRDELRDWLSELVEEPRHEYPGFVAGLSLLGALPPEEATESLRARLDHLARQRAEIRQLIDTSLADGVPGLFLVEEEYRLAVLEAERTFVEELIRRIADPATGWMQLWTDTHRTNPTPTEGP